MQEETKQSTGKIDADSKHEGYVEAFLSLIYVDDALKEYAQAIAKQPNNATAAQEQESLRLDVTLLFSRRLWEFITDVESLPLIYTHTQGDTPAWISKAMEPEQLAYCKRPTELVALLVTDPDKTFTTPTSAESKQSDEEMLQYSFRVGDDTYQLLVDQTYFEGTYSTDHTIKNQEPVEAYEVYVIENKSALVYRSKLYYKSKSEGHGDWKVFDGCHLKVFIPGQWTRFLLGKIFEVTAEKTQTWVEAREKVGG